MIDNKPLEEEAEFFVKSKLLRYGFNIAKPSFDIKGADLLILDNIDNHYSKILKIQSKGRTLKKTTNSIKIHESYVKDDFIVFLYAIDEENKEQAHLCVFFKEDIELWNKSNDNYTLSFTSKSILTDKFQSKIFNKETVIKINEILEKTEVKKYTSVVVDGIFLERIIYKTFNEYDKLYPEKNLQVPSTESVIMNITSMYNRFQSEENVLNFHIYNYNEDVDGSQVVAGNMIISGETENRIYFHETNGFIYKDIEEYFIKILNLENIIFVADDVIYEPILHELTDKNIDVILVMLSEAGGNNMFTGYKWGAIYYPIAQAMGLGQYEW
ncbi:hypothetical protein CSB62_25865 [Vibrio splendidus]|uniref:hypothetical protein n=1 Tax=Vibrio splendidus TaxID=29497 RepID=UPI000C06957F|nr:hypothetical protein [Vibrio splendidus]MDH5976099.1 hypothetical protein [Vibrio splendidus]PHN83116.1 hypothetical protein CSB62_25865 [Vibrio splendidus]